MIISCIIATTVVTNSQINSTRKVYDIGNELSALEYNLQLSIFEGDYHSFRQHLSFFECCIDGLTGNLLYCSIKLLPKVVNDDLLAVL